MNPTVGRIVYFVPDANSAESGFFHPQPGEPLAAQVAAVFDDNAGFVLNLSVLDAEGNQHPRRNVPFFQFRDDGPVDGYFAYWMPYQIDQAKKADDARQMSIAADRAADERRMRAGILDMALRTPGLSGQKDVIDAASAYAEYIERGGLGIKAD